jgi:hypothetical protein
MISVMEALPTIVPLSGELRRMREGLGLSQSELSDALGFGPNGAKTIRDWEHGRRGGEPFKPTGVAWTAFRYLVFLVSVYREMSPTDPLAADIRRVLPSTLQS